MTVILQHQAEYPESEEEPAHYPLRVECLIGSLCYYVLRLPAFTKLDSARYCAIYRFMTDSGLIRTPLAQASIPSYAPVVTDVLPVWETVRNFYLC